ncbi:MAG: hypothetical protein H0V84_07535 [Actinobacteria bacterium]|nr:hypothetical protein [Actinomycetota bacterium]
MSSEPSRLRQRPAEAVGGLIAAAAIAASAVGVAYRPIRLIPVALVLALIATAIGGRHGKLAAAAVAFGAVAFVAGTILAVLTENPLY